MGTDVMLKRKDIMLKIHFIFIFYPHLRTVFFFVAFRERGRGGGKERGRERNIEVREKYLLVPFSYASKPGTKPMT